MIFTPEHQGKIALGEKTETRRVWKRPHVRVGGVYRVRTSRFASAEPDAPLIRVTGIHLDVLGNIDGQAARREGCRSRREFVGLWKRLHASWRPEQKCMWSGSKWLDDS